MVVNFLEVFINTTTPHCKKRFLQVEADNKVSGELLFKIWLMMPQIVYVVYVHVIQGNSFLVSPTPCTGQECVRPEKGANFRYSLWNKNPKLLYYVLAYNSFFQWRREIEDVKMVPSLELLFCRLLHIISIEIWGGLTGGAPDALRFVKLGEDLAVLESETLQSHCTDLI